MTPASPAPPISCACTLTGAERGAALRVIGLGSPHDADQLGWLLAEALSAALAGRSDISVHVCRDPARELLGLLLGAQAALLVDALAQAGEVQSFGARSVYWLGVPLICDEHTVGVVAVQSYSSEMPFTFATSAAVTAT